MTRLSRQQAYDRLCERVRELEGDNLEAFLEWILGMLADGRNKKPFAELKPWREMTNEELADELQFELDTDEEFEVYDPE